MNRKHLTAGGLAILAAALLAAGCAGGRPAPVVEREADTFYQMTRFLMTAQESRVYRRLDSREARDRFIEYFWEIRDPNPLTPENEFRRMIRERFEYVNRYFNEGQRPGWRTDRGRFYMVLGPPEEADRNVQTSNPRYAGRIIDWYYGFSGASGTTFAGGGFRLRFVDERGFGVYRLDEGSMPLRVLDLMEELKYNMIVKRGEESPFPAPIDFSLEYRPAGGTLWVVFGPRKAAFSRRDGRITVSFHVDVLVFGAHEEINKVSRDWKKEFTEAEILEKDFRFRIPVPLRLGPGRHSLDVVVTDMLSGRKSRRIVTVKGERPE